MQGQDARFGDNRQPTTDNRDRDRDGRDNRDRDGP
jgi:hypothetical protein